MLAVDCGLVGSAQACEAKLGGGQSGLGELDRGVFACLDSALDDGNKRGGEVGLLADSGLALLVVVERGDGERGVLGDGLAHVIQRKLGGVQADAGRADVVELRCAEDQRSAADGEERRRIRAVAVRLSNCRAGVDGGNVGVVGLGELGARLGNIGLGPLYARVAAQRQIDRGAERKLGVSRERKRERNAQRQGA